MARYCLKFKEGVNIEDLKMVHPNLLILIGAFSLYGHQNNLPVKITSIMDDAAGRVSRSHIEGRAADFSVKGWSKLHINRVCYHINKKYKSIAAISSSDLKPRACIFHTVSGPSGFHCHLQIKP